MKSTTGRTLSPIFTVLALLLSAGGSAWADPSISFSNLSIVPSSAFNSIQAVCSPATEIAVSVDITATFDAAGTCLNLGGGTKRQATGGGALSALTAGDGTNSCTLLNTSGNTYACSLPVRPEGGPYTVTVDATATDGNTTTSCTGASQSPTKTSSTSTKYVTDEVAPTVRVASYSPNPDPNPIPQITAGSSIALNVKLKDGSSGTPYSFELEAYNATDTIGPAPLSGFSFDGPNGPNDDGKDPIENSRDIALQTSCTTPPGIYTMRLETNTEDLCGNPFAAIVMDPAGTTGQNPPPASQGNNPSGTFEVLSPVELSTVTHIIGPLPPNGDYSFEQCFTTKGNPKKLIVNPGSAHIAAVVNATVPDTCEEASITNPTIKLTLPAGFSFYLTGGSPAAHVFVGEAAAFDFHDPETDGLLEVTDAALISGQLTQTITVDLSNVDVGFGPGQIPTSDTIYVRAHTRYTGSDPTPHGQFTFLTEAGIGAVMTASDTEKLQANPAGGCSPDGLLL